MVFLGYYALALVLGLAQAWSFGPSPKGGLQIVVMAGLLALLRTARRPVRVMWAFGVAWFAGSLYWLHFSMHDIGGLPFALSVLAVFVLALCLTGFYALAVYIWARWRSGGASELWALCVGFPLAWLAAELGRGYLFFAGFPWVATGYAQTDNVFLKGWFALAGVYGVGFLVALMAGVLLSMVLLATNQMTLRNQLERAKKMVQLGLVASAWAVSGMVLQGVSWGRPDGAPVSVRMIQPNVAQNLKFDADVMRNNALLFMEQASTSRAALTVFPETALPFPWADLPDGYLNYIQRSLKNERAVLMGALVTQEAGDVVLAHNSAVWLDARSDMHAPARFDKAHLLPFGETIPTGFGWFVNAMNIPLGGYQNGTGYPRFTLNTPSGAVRVATNICFENTFGEELIGAWEQGDAQAPHVWVNMTNLGWFGTANISTNQAHHLQMSRARAMEMARPMLVVTNTGSSAQIDAVGDLVDVLPADEAVVRDVMVQPMRGTTPYVRLGNRPWLVLIGLVGAWLLYKRVRKVAV